MPKNNVTGREQRYTNVQLILSEPRCKNSVKYIKRPWRDLAASCNKSMLHHCRHSSVCREPVSRCQGHGFDFNHQRNSFQRHRKVCKLQLGCYSWLGSFIPTQKRRRGEYEGIQQLHIQKSTPCLIADVD